MERSDSRLLPVAVLNERRRRAVMLRLSGMKLEQVCALSELSDNTVRAAMQAYERGGWVVFSVNNSNRPSKRTFSRTRRTSWGCHLRCGAAVP